MWILIIFFLIFIVYIYCIIILPKIEQSIYIYISYYNANKVLSFYATHTLNSLLYSLQQWEELFCFREGSWSKKWHLFQISLTLISLIKPTRLLLSIYGLFSFSFYSVFWACSVLFTLFLFSTCVVLSWSVGYLSVFYMFYIVDWSNIYGIP